MNELEIILSQLMNIEYNMDSLCIILQILKTYYQTSGTDELNAIICIIENQLNDSKKNLANSMTKLDNYLLENK